MDPSGEPSFIRMGLQQPRQAGHRLHCAVSPSSRSVDVVRRMTANIPMEVANLVSLNA